MTAITEESLSVSGVLLAKVFNRQQREVQRYREENARQVDLQVRQAMTGQSFFTVVQTFFGITPALIYLVAGLLIASGSVDHRRHDRRGHARCRRGCCSRRSSCSGSRWTCRPRSPCSAASSSTSTWSPRSSTPRTPARSIRRGDGAGASWRTSGSPTPPSRAGSPATPRPHAGRRRERCGRPPIALGAAGRRSSRPGSWPPSSGRAARARRRSPIWCPRLYDVDRGRVLIDGNDVRELTQASSPTPVGMVTQDTYLLHATIADNLRYANPEATQEEIETAARAANIHDRIMSFAEGYDDRRRRARVPPVRREKQRLAIARVLLKDPRDPHPRRGHERAGHHQRAAGPGGAGARDQAADDDRDRAPALHGAGRRRHPRRRRRAGSRARHAHRASGPRRALRAAVRRAVRRRRGRGALLGRRLLRDGTTIGHRPGELVA